MEVNWRASAWRLHLLPSTTKQLINATAGDLINTDVTLTAHVQATVRVCFSAPRQIWSAQRSVSLDLLVVLHHTLLWLKLISAVQHWFQYKKFWSLGYNMSLMLQLRLHLPHGNLTMSINFTVTYIGWNYRRDSSFGSLCRSITAVMALLQYISLTNWCRPMSTSIFSWHICRLQPKLWTFYRRLPDTYPRSFPNSTRLVTTILGTLWCIL